MITTTVMLYKPDGGVKEYAHAKGVITATDGFIHFTARNGEVIESNLPYVVAMRETEEKK